MRVLVPRVAAWHRWFLSARDPGGQGLVALLHPWESGRDNSVDWDAPFARVPTDGIAPCTRRDTQHADPAHRPTKEQHDRSLWLVEHVRGLGWDNARLHDASPIRVASHPPSDPRLQAKRCWRGPVWLVVNCMIADGLARAGQEAAADAITRSSLDPIRESGFAEYDDPRTGEPLGGGRFTWTAAMVLEFLAMDA